MYFFEKNKYKLILAAVTVVLVLVMAFSSVSRGKTGIIAEGVGVVLSPFQKAFTAVSDGVSEFFDFVKSAKTYKQQNTDLKKQIAELEQELRKSDTMSAENERLRTMLELKEKNTQYNYIAADVISSDVTNWSKTFTINKGLADGISKNMAVVSPYGLVGYTYEVGRNSSKIVTILDAGVSVGASINRVNVYSLVEGDISLQSKGQLKMLYISKDSNVEEGDYVMTSGNGGIYPQGLFIGKIVNLSEDTSGMSQQAIIEPGVDFDNLSEVFVIASK